MAINDIVCVCVCVCSIKSNNMGSDKRNKWLSVGYQLLVAVLNVSLVSVMGLDLKQTPHSQLSQNIFNIAGIVMNFISLVINSLKIIIGLFKLRKHMAKSDDKSCVGKTVACMEIIIFFVVYIGNIVMLAFNSVILTDSNIQDKTLLIISCVLFVIMFLIQSVLLLIIFVYCLKKCCAKKNADTVKETDPLMS